MELRLGLGIILTVSNLSSDAIEVFVGLTKNFTRSPNTDLSRQCEAASTPFLMSTLYKFYEKTFQFSFKILFAPVYRGPEDVLIPEDQMG